MSEEKTQKSITIPIPSFKSLAPVLLVLSIGLAFFVGVLWQKVQNLQNGSAISATTKGNIVAAPEAGSPSFGSADQVEKLKSEDHVRGDRNARVLLIEYSDLECPYCKQFHPTAQKVLDTYKGQVAWVYRHFPLSFHQNAQKEAEASECVNEQGGNDVFWKFVDAIFDRTTSNGTGFALDKLGPLAKELGLDQTKFQSCLDSGKYTKHVQDDETAGGKAGVNGTPGNILLYTKTGKTKLIPGALPYEQFKQAIDDLLSGK